jgi:hypothetical protein
VNEGDDRESRWRLVAGSDVDLHLPTGRGGVDDAMAIEGDDTSRG